MTQSEKAANKFAYFPGCSLTSSAAEYDHSARKVFAHIGVELVELPGWSCCGASSAHNVNHELATALPFRNLAMAEPEGMNLITPCASCYNRLKVAETTALGDPVVKKRMEEIVEKTFKGDITTLSILEVLTEHVGLDKVREKVVKKLSGLKVVCYYGCLMARPPRKLSGHNPDNPTEMDAIVEALGAEAKFWSYKTDCCGAAHAMAREDIVITLVGKLHDMAREAGADAIVTACSMCHANVDMRQEKGDPLPIFYFSELMALAMGMDEVKGWLEKHIISPLPLLEKLKLI